METKKLKNRFNSEFKKMACSYKKRRVHFAVTPEISFIFPLAEKHGLGVIIHETEPLLKGEVFTILNEISLF